MRLLLALNYKRENAAALAVYNTETQLFDVFYRHEFAQEYPLCGFRGMVLRGDQVIVTTSVELLFFRISKKPEEPLFVLEKTVRRPEWIVGAGESGSLLDVCFSESKNRLFVAYFSMDAIDELDFDGNLISRRYIGDILPFDTELYNPKSTTGYFYLSRLKEYKSKMYAVLTSIGGGKGAVLDIENDEIVLNNLEKPQGIYFYGNKLFVNNSMDISVSEYVAGFSADYTLAKTVELGTSRPLWKDSFEYLNAIYADEINEKIYSFASHWKSLKVNQAPARIFEYRSDSGEICGEYILPEFSGLSVPYVYSMTEINTVLTEAAGAKTDSRLFTGIDTAAPCLCRPNVFMKAAKEGTKEVVPVSSMKTEESKKDADPCENPEIVIEGKNIFLNYRKRSKMFSSKPKMFTALDDVSFRINSGGVVGLIGRNGSGKSTLGKVIAGVLKPDKGSVYVNGRVSLLTLGTGFKQDLSGRDNIYINAAMLGYSKKHIHSVADNIIDFTEIGEFIDEPIRTYSSGMKSRLGFAIAAFMKPDILVIDEVLSTGDNYFRAKAKKKIAELMEEAKCVIIVSHQLDFLRNVCGKCLWLEKGLPVMFGNADLVISEYSNYGKNPESWCRKNSDKPVVKRLLEKINAAGR